MILFIIKSEQLNNQIIFNFPSLTTMTLYIKLVQCEKMQQRGYLFVEGSKSGLLMTPLIGDGNYKLSQIFRIVCSATDNLNLKYCKSRQQYLSGECIGQTYFHVPTIIKKYKQQINLDDDFIQDIELLNPSGNEVVGVLVFDVTYDNVSYFQGEFGTTNKAMIVQEPKLSHKFALYKGKCATKNLFSLLDEAAEGQSLKFIQSIYKDE